MVDIIVISVTNACDVIIINGNCTRGSGSDACWSWYLTRVTGVKFNMTVVAVVLSR